MNAETLKSLMDVSAVTADGTEITLMGNISDAEGLKNVFENGGEGVGGNIIDFPGQL
ncbi:hypothetical protein [Daejeonella sp.]|uniref:hypothetical protein n=1 Tax=Daejeonella sp. TaxID=2805397 RepID=UPI0030C52806